jgi:HD-like signal output (HDOD) protein
MEVGRIINIQGVISEKKRIPSPPAIAIRILDMVRKDDFSFSDLAQIIESDPALVAKILKAVNSSYYNLPARLPALKCHDHQDDGQRGVYQLQPQRQNSE